MITKQRFCNLIRRNYPEFLGIRKTLQKQKVKRLYRHMLSKDEIALGEKDPNQKKNIVSKYLEKDYLQPVIREMEDILDNAAQYRSRNDKEDLRADIIFCRLAYGFIPSEYVGFELEKKKPEERKKFYSDIDTLAFGYSVNNIRELQYILDKADSSKKFAKYYKRDTVVIEKKSDYEAYKKFVLKHPIFVEKEVISSMGKGTTLVNLSLLKETAEEHFNRLVCEGKYLLEERIAQQEVMAQFNSSSVNTIRCITLRVKKEVVVPYCFMRTGRRGSFVDNGGSGGLLIGIDVKTGTLNTAAYDEYNDKYLCHPDSGIEFKEFQIPEWNELIRLCKKAAMEEKDMGFLSWDLAYTDDGWVVIEVNEIGQLIGPQIVMKKGIKLDMERYFLKMKKMV